MKWFLRFNRFRKVWIINSLFTLVKSNPISGNDFSRHRNPIVFGPQTARKKSFRPYPAFLAVLFIVCDLQLFFFLTFFTFYNTLPITEVKTSATTPILYRVVKIYLSILHLFFVVHYGNFSCPESIEH